MCLVIALKARNSTEIAPSFTSEFICNNMYLTDEITAMEIEILRILNWHLNGPTAHDYLLTFIELLPQEADREMATSFFGAAIRMVEVGLLDYTLALEAPSTLAVVAVTSLVRAMDYERRQALNMASLISRIRLVIGASIGSRICPNQHADE